ncbi:MAG: T9SS type A sorting domain-containing protein [Bacteroidales bacterium]
MWKEYAGIFANNLANDQEIYYLSRTDKLFVSMLADHCEYGRANVFAQNLLSMLYGYEYEMCESTTRSSMVQSLISDNSTLDISIGNAYPKPANNRVYVPYKCPDDMSVSIQVTDLTGRVIKTMALLKGESLLDLEVDSFTPGMYQIKFTFGNNDVNTAKFVKQ